ncbi:MAG TPA: efflux RND transporter permease subunit [Chloroflexota bacterium]|nr:efflux RND transporter permease subunit [Chloroflexota bacterium]
MTRFAIRHPLPMLMAVLAVVLMGAVAHGYLNVDRLPPLSFPVITVNVGYPQAAAQDVEQLVTQPIEDALAGVEGIDTIESTSSEGRARIRVTLSEGADPDLAALDVERRISRIRAKLPAEITDPSIFKADPNEIPVMNIALTGAPPDDLYDVAQNQLLPTLESVVGVASVNLSGGLQREMQVRVDYSKLAAYNLSVQQITDALTGANVTSTVGSVENGYQRLNVRAVGAFQSPEDLRNLVIVQPTGGPVLLRDVANVQEGYKQITQIQRINGQDAVGLSVVKASTANALEVADGIRKALNRLQSTLPAGTQVYVTNDLSKYTRTALDAVQSDLVLAVVLVALVVLAFLHAWRNMIIIILAIPTSMISTFLVMFILGFSLNLMTLMALALIVGILVDDSTVVIENIHRHLQMGEEPKEAALRGRNEIGMAAMAITAADIVVYTPIAFMSGLVGQLFRQYGLTVVAATIFSFLVSFTLTPMLASRWLKQEEDHGSGLLAGYGRWWDRWFDRLGRLVERVVPAAVHARWIVVAGGVSLLVMVALLIQTRVVGTEYAPGEDSDAFQVSMTAQPGTSLDVISRASQQVEDAMLQMPEVQYVFSTIAAPGAGFGSTTAASSRISVQLIPKKERERSVFDIVQQVRQFGRQIPDVRVIPSVPSSFPGGGGSGGLNFDVNGPDVDVLNQLVDQLEAAVSRVPGLADVQDSSDQSSPEVQIVFDSARMAQLGVTTQQATTALRTTLGGLVVTELRRPGKLQEDITVIAGDADRTDLNKLAAIPIKGTSANAALTASASSTSSSSGVSSSTALVTLGQVATIRPGTGPVQIQRLNRNRNIEVSGTAVGRPLGDVAGDMQAVLKAEPVPAGYTVSPGRSVNRFTEALMALLQALVLALIMEYMLLVALYESWFYPFVLILSVPLGLVGSVLALWVTGNTINIFSLMGLVMAFGLVAKNGILLVDFTNQLRKQGMERTAALAQAARTRLRPILMTSCTMLFGMLPLAFKSESGAESRAPMAVVVIGAILTSTLLAVIVLPAVYTLFDDLQSLLARRPAMVPTTAPTPAPVPEPVLAASDVGAQASYRNGARRGAGYYLRRAAALRERRRTANGEAPAHPSPTHEPA